MTPLTSDEADAEAERILDAMEAAMFAALGGPMPETDSERLASVRAASDAMHRHAAAAASTAALRAELERDGRPVDDREADILHYVEGYTAASLDIVAALPTEAPPPAKKRGPPRRGAAVVPYYTFPPLDALRLGLSDHRGRYWRERPGEGIFHDRDKAEFRVSYVSPGRSLAEHLQTLARHGGLESAMLAGVLTLHGLQHNGEAIAIDDGLAEIGWARNRGQSRDDARRWFAEAALFMNGCNVTGSGWGRFRGVDVSCRGPLFTTRIHDPEQGALEGIGEPVPLAFSVQAGDFLDAVRGEPSALHYCGTLAALAGVPRGKPGGYWAAAAGMAGLQRWRELAPKPNTKRGHAGEDNKPTLRGQAMTRRYLLTTYLPGPRDEGDEREREDEDARCPSVFDVLASKNPGRAKTYWNQAMAHLKAAGIVASADPKVYGSGKPLPRYAWGDAWLDEPLNLQPPPELLATLADINREAAAVRRAEARRKRRPKGT